MPPLQKDDLSKKTLIFRAIFRRSFLVCFLGGMVAGGVLTAVFCGREFSKILPEKPATKTSAEDMPELSEWLKLVVSVADWIEHAYVEEVDLKSLFEGALQGMVGSLDPHSSFLLPRDYESLSETTQGSYAGLGMRVQAYGHFIQVVAPLDGSPAAKAGIKPQDIILSIDGIGLQNYTEDEAIAHMKGKEGTWVDIKILRQSGDKRQTLTLRLQRAVIRLENVTGHRYGDILYIRLAQFAQTTAEELEDRIARFQKEKKMPPFKGLVLDLRNNPGGVLESSVDVSDLFLSQGEIVSVRSRNKEENRVFIAHEGDILRGRPIVVLVDSGTASAAEIVSGALQDQGRAVIVGQQTFGKGSVQSIFPIGKYGALRLTTARYYTPSGKSIQSRGIRPNVAVPLGRFAPLEDNVDFSIKEENYVNALENDRDEGIVETRLSEEDRKNLEGDYMLQRGLDLVSALSAYAQASADKKSEKEKK